MKIKRKIHTNKGLKGGLVGGKSHAENGTKAIIIDDSNKPIELEAGEAVVKKSALKDKTVKTLTGTNAQILNLINTRAGGNPIYAPSEVNMKNGGRVGSDDFSDIESLISKGIVEIEYEKSTEKHAKEYGLQCKKPLYLKRIYVRKDYRLKGVGKRVLKYLDFIAQKNSNDCIFGYVSNKVIFTKDNRDVNYNDVQLFKFWLHENGYAINDDNNDFHKVISLKMAKGGSDDFKGSTISDKTINEETDFIAEYLEDNGFFIRRGARSRTDFGESNYLYAHNKVDEGGFPMGDGVKIRISDHSVSNFDRMYNEIHVGITDTKESWEKSAFSILMQLQWQYDKNNKYRKEDAVEIKKVTIEIPESQLRINPPYADKILSERISNNGKKLLTVERTYSNSIEKWYHKESGTYYTTIKPNVFDKGGSIDNEDNIKNKWKSVGKMAKGGSIEDNCISFIKNSEAIKNNGYFHYFKNISIYADFGTKVPKVKSFYLCAYNSGGQKNLKVTDTLNLDLINKLQEIIDCEKSICRIVVDEFFRKAKRIESNDLSRMTGENIIVVDRYNIVCDNIKNEFSSGGSITPSAINNMTKAEQKAFYKTKEGKELDKQTHAKWKSLVNMSKGELESFYNSKEGKEAGLSASEAKAEGIDSGRESARWIMKMKDIPYTEWTSNMWIWAKKQISFVSRMKGMRGDLYDDKGNKTRKHLALLIWGHNPKKMAEGGVIPQQGTLFTKDKKNKLDYKKVGNDYVFKVYDVESNPVENYTRHQCKKRNNNEATMDYNQFINYLYSEHYIDDKKMAEGGVTGDVFSIKDPEQFKQLITLYNKFSEKFDVDNYFVDDSSVVFLRKVKFTDAELKGMAQYIADLSKNQNFSIISDKKPEISNGYFKFFLKERVRYKDGGNVGNDFDYNEDMSNESLMFEEGGNIPSETKTPEQMAKEFLNNLSQDAIEELKSKLKEALSELVVREKNALDVINAEIADLEAKKESLKEDRSDYALRKRSDYYMEIKKRQKALIHQTNRYYSVKNGGSLSTFTDKKGLEHESIPDFTSIGSEDISFDEENILTQTPPQYIPIINEEEFRIKGYLFDAIRYSSDIYLLAVNGYRETISKGWEDTKEHPSDAEQGYVLVTLDQLILINDYYYTKAKATERKKAEETNKRTEESYDRIPRERRENHYAMRYFYEGMPVSVKKKVSKDAWEALTLEQKEAIYKPIKVVQGKRLVSKLEDDRMWASFHNMYERFLNPEAKIKTEKGVKYGHPEVFSYWYAFRDMMKWKLKDIKFQRQFLSDMRKTALETSFGMSNTNELLYDNMGILIKRQNGSNIKPIEIEQIRKGWINVNNVYGGLVSLAKEDAMKISHTGTTLVFASKAAGVYIPTMKTIAVSAKYGDAMFESILAHEVAHWIDNKIGEQKRLRWATDNYEDTAGIIASTFRNKMNKKSDSDYINATKECFARALEQHFSISIFGENATVFPDPLHPDLSMTYFQSENYVNKDVYESAMKPLIDKFFEENKDFFKYGIETNEADANVSKEVAPIITPMEVKTEVVMTEEERLRKEFDDLAKADTMTDAQKATIERMADNLAESLKLKKLKLTNKAMKMFANSPAQLEIRKEIDEISSKIAELEEKADESMSKENLLASLEGAKVAVEFLEGQKKQDMIDYIGGLEILIEIA